MTDTSLMTTRPLRSPAPRPKSIVWRLGDAWTDPVSGLRWIIRTLNTSTGAVELEAANAVSSSVWWRTTIDRLPKKGI
ncbi:hypothetical protein [Microbacterium sp. G2-8]|uniref:hypothetical protein n=1 Tax=Microbacterium sp. G2-8 TaxID=2842454 RepID=UPI001C8A7285|nr:hypothetical protein [Microbacterium sp. G2-8]